MKENESEKKGVTDNGVFGQLPKEKWDELSRAMEDQVAARGTIIFREGDPGNRFFIIHSGKVRVFKTDAEGMETDLNLLGAGDSFGEMALLTGEPRSASVEAVEETRLKVLSREQFELILKDFPHISLAFVRQMSKWLARDEKIIGSLLRDERIIERELQQAHRMSWVDFLLVIGVSAILAIVFNKSNPNGIPLFPKFPDKKEISEISATQAMEEMRKGEAIIVDAGPEVFYEKKHIQEAISIPLSLFDIVYVMAFGEEERGKKIIVYGGTFSKLYDWELADKLLLRGHKDVKVLEGGMAAWEKEGYPVEAERGKE